MYKRQIKTHNLERLIFRCESFDVGFRKLLSQAVVLNDYIVTFRYPGYDDEPDDDEAKQAIKYATYILNFVKKRIEAALSD